ncbi:MAG: hypothetical protein F7B60_07480 [Desulfurococcales archaeon]|nr:hypothetical protein [Desulfurococcales archaeon]
MSKAEELFRIQFLLTIKIIISGLVISMLGYLLGRETVNAIVILGLALVTISPLISFYITLKRYKTSNIK